MPASILEICCAHAARSRLGGVGGNHTDVSNVIAFFEGWDRVDVQDDTGDRSPGFEDNFAEVVGDKADFHALLNVGAAPHKRVPNAGAIRQDIDDSVEPDGILDGPRLSWEHFESAHGAECPVDEEGDVIRLDGPGIASFDDHGRFAASSGGVVKVASGGKVGGAVTPYDDVVQSKGEDHLFGFLVLGLLASGCPVRIRAEALVEIATVVVDKIIASVDDLCGDNKGCAFGLRSIGFPGVKAVHALVIDGVNVRYLLFEGGNVDERNQDDGAGDLRGIKQVDEFFNRDDGCVFGTVSARDQSQDRTMPFAVDDYNGNIGSSVDTS